MGLKFSTSSEEKLRSQSESSQLEILETKQTSMRKKQHFVRQLSLKYLIISIIIYFIVIMVDLIILTKNKDPEENPTSPSNNISLPQKPSFEIEPEPLKRADAFPPTQHDALTENKEKESSNQDESLEEFWDPYKLPSLLIPIALPGLISLLFCNHFPPQSKTKVGLFLVIYSYYLAFTVFNIVTFAYYIQKEVVLDSDKKFEVSLRAHFALTLLYQIMFLIQIVLVSLMWRFEVVAKSLQERVNAKEALYYCHRESLSEQDLLGGSSIQKTDVKVVY
jgi:hypothetical protein